MTDQSPASLPAQFFGNVWGQVLSILTVVTMLLGIFVEGLTIWSGVNDARISHEKAGVADVKEKALAAEAAFNAEIGQEEARNAEIRAAAEAKDAAYKAEMAKYEAANAEARQKAESDLAVAKAKVAGATANVQERLAKAQAENAEAKATKERLEAELTAILMQP